MPRGVFVLLVVLVGCVDVRGLLPREPSGDTLLLREAYRAADILHDQLKGTEAERYPLLVAAFVDAADVERVDAVGRLLAEQVASRLGQRGYAMKDIQLRAHSLVLRPQGVLALSRCLDDVDPEAAGYAVVVGTVTTVNSRLFVNVRVVRAADGVVLAAADMDLPATALVPRPKLPHRQPSVATTLDS